MVSRATGIWMAVGEEQGPPLCMRALPHHCVELRTSAGVDGKAVEPGTHPIVVTVSHRR